MILSIEELSISSRDRSIVDQVSLAVREGEFMALVGQSGSGKACSRKRLVVCCRPTCMRRGESCSKAVTCSNGSQRRCAP